ncbi:MAG: DNA internalization-related competence protein ComEC/Rec2 [Nitrospirota bacterium]
MQFFISFLAGILLFHTFQYFPLSSVIAISFFSVYFSIKKKFFPILILFLGTAFAFARYEPVKYLPAIKNNVNVVGAFDSPAVMIESGMFRQTLKAESALDTETGRKLKALEGREIVLLSDIELRPCTEYDLDIKFLKKRARLNPGEWNQDKLFAKLLKINNWKQRRISFNSKIQEFRYRLNRYIAENFRDDSGAFIASITTGQRVNIDEELRDAFNRTGLAHILSISGTHFGLFSVLLFWVFRFLITALPYRILQRITISLTPSQAAAILCTPFMIVYLGLSGGTIPAVRSFIMISLFLLGLVIGRRGFWLNSLLFAAFVIALWEPEAIFDLSFQLSFLAVLFIGFSLNKDTEEREKGPVIEKKISQYIRKFLDHLKNILLLTLSASIGTAPLVANHFHYFSIISPLSNLFIAPLIGFVLIPLSVISSFLFLLTGHYLFTPFVSTLADLSIYLIRLSAEFPFADIKIPAFPSIVVLLFYGGFIFYLLLNRRRYFLIIPFVPLAIYLLLSLSKGKEINITYLDVGQGDSSVLELPDGKTIVIDTGRSGREAASFLKYRGKDSIDALILSHSHPDHTGGLSYLLNRFDVKEIWDNGRLILPDNTISDIKHRSLVKGDMLEGTKYAIYILHPYPEFYTMYGNDYDEANNDSLVLKIAGRKKTFLFTGDIEEEAEKEVLQLGRWLKSDVIKVPHHGGKTSSYEPFLKAVSPGIAVISVGRDNSFGHPHKETLDALKGAKIFRTDIDGATKIKEAEKGLEIKTYTDLQISKARSLSDEMKNISRLFETW